MITRLPRLVPPRMVAPTRLMQACAGLPEGEPLPMHAEPKHLAAARAIVAAYDGTPKFIGRQLVVPLLRLLQDEKIKRQRSIIVWNLLRADSIPWRRFWMLWELCSEHRQHIVPKLAKRLHQRAQESEKFRFRLPQWLPVAALEDLQNALMEPDAPIQRFCERHSVHLNELPRRLHLMDSSDIGNSAILNLIRNGHSRWWGSMAPEQIRHWATERGNRDLTAAIADRLLREAGGTADSPGRLERNAESRELVKWVLKSLGDPMLRVGLWASVSERAREVFEWLLLVDEFQKIIDEFRRYSEDDRASYWADKFEAIHDALYYDAKDSAICMMVIGRSLVIEFGTAGNACYVYDALRPPRLRSLAIKEGSRAKDFKAKGGLLLGNTHFAFRQSLTHHSSWQYTFDHYFAENA